MCNPGWFAAAVLLVTWKISTARISYEGYEVWSVMPQTEKGLSFLRNLQEHQHLEVDFWNDPSSLFFPVDVMVGPSSAAALKKLLSEASLRFSVIIHNVERLIEQTFVRPHTPVSLAEVDTDRYYSLGEIHDFLHEQEQEFEGQATVISIGQSYEGRDLPVLKISRPEDSRRAIWIDAGIHAREWIAPAVANYIISRLLHDYESDPDVKRIRDEYDWYIHPVVNPDGYKHTWDVDRMWRKTRSETQGSSCIGVDANRNFDFMWDSVVGSSPDPCSENYRGPYPASEPEITAIQDFLLDQPGLFNISVTLHSFGQIFVLPWGYTLIPPDDVEELLAIGCAAKNVTEDVNDMNYLCMRGMGVLSGNTMDWAKGAAGIKYSYLIELRDRGTYGFLLPPEFIFDTANEIWEGVKALALSLLDSQ